MPGSTITTTPSAHMRRQRTVHTLASGDIELLDSRERKYYEAAQNKYLTENTFTVASDLRALDRLVFAETLVMRYQTQLASGFDPDGNQLTFTETDQARRNIKDTTGLIGNIQTELGLTRAARERDQMESVAAYITKLKLAAKEHGIKREKELGKALELIHELFSLAGAYQRSSPNERIKLGFESADDIIEWVMSVMKPDFDAVDEYFRTHAQKFFLREL